MRLIADSGSSSTDWLLRDNNRSERFATQGLNPFLMGIERFREILSSELLPHIKGQEIETIEFYGAGCKGEIRDAVSAVMRELIPSVVEIIVESDLLLACRAVCGESEGLVALLGTGSNSCLYNGREIVSSIPSLGFILGDEGSGAALGRSFLNALMKKRLTASVEEAFYKEYPLAPDNILQHVYHSPRPSAFLASFAPFILRMSAEQKIEALIISSFRSFLANNMRPYNRPDLPIHCVGSIAHYFSRFLLRAAEAEGFIIGEIVSKPIEKYIP